MTRIHLLLTSNNEHNQEFKDVPIIGFRSAKSLNYILVRAKIPLVKKKVGTVLVKDLDVKFANILHPLEFLYHLLQKAHMRLDQKI